MTDIKYFCSLLPDTLCGSICNYLYYSNDVWCGISPSLHIINNYPEIIMKEILNVHHNSENNTNKFYDFYTMFLRWVNLDKNNKLYYYIQNNVALDYDEQDKTRQIEDLLHIMKYMNMFQIQDYYNYMYH